MGQSLLVSVLWVLINLSVSEARGKKVLTPPRLFLPLDCGDEDYCEGSKVKNYPEIKMREIVGRTNPLMRDMYESYPEDEMDSPLQGKHKSPVPLNPANTTDQIYPDITSRLRPHGYGQITTDTSTERIQGVSVRISSDVDLSEYLDWSPVCESIVSFIFPRTARNRDSEWRFVINVPGEDQKENFVQAVRVEKCLRPGQACNIATTHWETTECRQKYTYRRLMAISAEGEQYVDSFRFPSSCICYQQKASLYYNSMELLRSPPDDQTILNKSNKPSDQQRKFKKSSPLISPMGDQVMLSIQDEKVTVDGNIITEDEKIVAEEENIVTEKATIIFKDKNQTPRKRRRNRRVDN